MSSYTQSIDYKTCKHILRAGARRGEVCGKPGTFNTYAQRVDYCSSHYVWNLTHDDNTLPSPKRSSNRPTYKKMILDALEDLDPHGKTLTSAIAIKKYLRAGGIDTDGNPYIRAALSSLVREGRIVCVRASYRLASGPKTEVVFNQMWLE